MTNPCTAKSDELLCNGCSQCANVCPYGAISYETKLINDHGIREDRRVAVVNSALCQGCGACTVTCRPAQWICRALQTDRFLRRWMQYVDNSKRRVQAEDRCVLLQLVQLRRRRPCRQQPLGLSGRR